jgi:hypothetical protein
MQSCPVSQVQRTSKNHFLARLAGCYNNLFAVEVCHISQHVFCSKPYFSIPAGKLPVFVIRTARMEIDPVTCFSEQLNILTSCQ